MFKYIIKIVCAGMVFTATNAAENTQVKTMSLAEIASYPVRSAPATVVSLNEATVSAEISARVTNIPVRVGDMVERDGIIVIMNCDDYELGEQQSESAIRVLTIRIDLAQKRLQRTRSLRQQDSISEEALDERTSDLAVMEAEMDSARAVLSKAKINKSRCRITSPFRALVTERISAVGQYAAPGTPLVRLVDIEDIEISAQIPATEISQLKNSQQLYFSYANERYPVQLRTILPVINSETRSQEVRLLFAMEKSITGAAGKLFWSDNRSHIPANILVEREGRLGIFIENEGMAIFQPVIDAQPGHSTPVELPKDTQIIIEGHYSLSDRAAVKVTD